MIPELNHVSSFGDSFAEAEAKSKKPALGYMETVMKERAEMPKPSFSFRGNLSKNIRSGQCQSLTLCQPKQSSKNWSLPVLIKTHQRGSHVYLKNADKIVTVPLHGGNKNAPIGTLHNIVVKQANLSIEKFNNL